jgi:serine/threonine protein kinase/Leucine-rich repeat (LRR) protein
MVLPSSESQDELAKRLAESEVSQGTPDKTVLSFREELEDLQQHLRQPSPNDPYCDEAACQEAIESASSLGRDRTIAPVAGPSAGTLPPMGAAVQQTLGQYELLKLLGQGGMGAVYQARHIKLDKIVALKVLPGGKLQDPHTIARFEREMRAVGKLQHQHIVAAHDAGEIDGTHYLVMELVDGVDLSAIVKRQGVLPVTAACELVRQAALGLQHAHEHGLVHRDIKPSNLMLTRPQRNQPPLVKILDMGLALLEESSAEGDGDLTSTGQIMGTIDYMAPEQSTNTHQVDIRADIYSLGATLFKLLTGRAPFAEAKTDTVVKKLMALATQPAPNVRTIRTDCPIELATLVDRLLAKDPGDRPTTPMALAEDLGPFARGADLPALFGEGTLESSTVFWPSLTRTQATVEPQTPTVVLPERSSQRPRRRQFVLGGSAAAFLLVGVVIAVTLRPGDSTAIVAPNVPQPVKLEKSDGHRRVAASPARFDLDREVAEWVVSKKGRVFAGTNGEKEIVWISDLNDVTAASSVEVHGIELSNSKVVNDDLDRLVHLQHLSQLILHGTQIDRGAIPRLAGCRALESLIIAEERILTSDLSPLASLPRLNDLDLNVRQVDDGGLALHALSQLRDIALYGSSDSVTLALAKIPQLRILWCKDRAALSPEVVQQCQEANPYLRIVVGNGKDARVLGKDPLRELAKRLLDQGVSLSMWKLPEWSDLGHYELTETNPFNISSMQFPAGFELSEQDAAALTTCTILYEVKGEKAIGTDRLVSALAEQIHLRRLLLKGSDLTDAGLSQLEKSTSLEQLDLQGTKVTRTGIQEFHSGHLDCAVKSDYGELQPQENSRRQAAATAAWPEMPEPPPLEEWLKGRGILTVKQDGSAMFTTIQAALDAQQAGQVVRVLDKGPYRETLTWRQKSYGGLVTDVRTVIFQERWRAIAGGGEVERGHSFSELENCRLSGFDFVSKPLNENHSQMMQMFKVPGMCCEDCTFSMQGGVPSLSVFPKDSPDVKAPFCIRNCVFATRLEITMGERERVLVIRNWLQNHGNDAVILNFFWKHSPAFVSMQQNITTVSEFGTAWRLSGDLDALHLRFHQNTMLGGTACWFRYRGPAGPDVTVQDNLTLQEKANSAFLDDADDSLPLAREHWTINRNYGSGTSTIGENWLPLADESTTQRIRLLSSDPLDHDYLRIDPASISIPNGDPFPGALPLGPAPAEGDWFTRLQERRRKVQEWIKSNEGKLESTEARVAEKESPAVVLNRSIAEKLIAAGASAQAKFVDSAGGDQRISPTTGIPGRPFDIVIMNLPSSTEAVEILRDAFQLRGLYQVGFMTRADRDAFPQLAQLKRLTNVWLALDADIVPDDLKQLSQLPRLGRLALHHDAVLRCAAVLPQLEHVRVLTVSQGNDDDLRLLANCPNLRSIELINGSASEPAVRELQRLNPHVRVIVYSEKSPQIIGLDPSVAAARRLLAKGVRFEVSAAPYSENPKHILTAEDLNQAAPWIFFDPDFSASSSSSFTAEDLRLIDDLQLLGTCRLSRKPDASSFLPSLRAQSSLNSLVIEGSPLTAEDLAQLAAMPWLNAIWFGNAGISREDVDVLRKSLPYTTIHCEFGEFEPLANSDDAFLRRVSALPALEKVDAVRNELQRCNPGSAAQFTCDIQNGKAVTCTIADGTLDDLSPLLALTELKTLKYAALQPQRDAAVLREITSLEQINGRSAAAFRLAYPANKPKTGVDDAWLESVRNLPERNRLKVVMQKLQDQNPNFDGKYSFEIIAIRVARLNFFSDAVTDLSPLKALPHLQTLNCDSSRFHGTSFDSWLSDLSPLAGMPLTRLICSCTRVSDLSPLAGMPLTGLHCTFTDISDLTPLAGMPLERLDCFGTPIADLSPLAGMPLTHLDCGRTQVSDLTPLKGMKLTELFCHNTAVSDLTPLKGMNLKMLRCAYSKVSDLAPLRGMPLTELDFSEKSPENLAIVREIRTLQKINDQSAAEFWKQIDARSPGR